VRDRVPGLRLLLQVADESGNPLLDGALDYAESVDAASSAAPPVEPSPDDLYILYTGGTTGMPKGVLWRQADIFMAAMGGRPFGSPDETATVEAVAARAVAGNGIARMMVVAPLMHGAAQWAGFNAFTNGGTLVMPAEVRRLDPADVWRTAERERTISLPVVGDAVARPLMDELERNEYDTSNIFIIGNGGAALTPAVKAKILELLPNVTILDSVGASETGLQLSHSTTAGSEVTSGTFSLQPGAVVVDEGLERILPPGHDGLGWLGQQGRVPLGYLGDGEKTARTFPVIDGVRYSIPGDRARLLADGQFELLGRDSVCINSGGEKIFAEEVERALTEHPDVYDVIVVGRPSQRWGNEVVAVVQPRSGAELDDDSLIEVCRAHLAGYKVPKAFVHVDQVVRSPSGKADYRWAASVAKG
jgi:fatty-acyl-CoA synthase